MRSGFADRLTAGMLERPAGNPFDYRPQTPLLGMPSLEVDATFDVADHVHRITLEAPGTLQQLFDRLCEMHQQRRH